jgi:hypothetical protein
MKKIKRVHVPHQYGDNYNVGHGGVTRITQTEVPGQMAGATWQLPTSLSPT